MVRDFAWALNLDADDELGELAGYAPSRAMEGYIAEAVTRLSGLLAPGDVVIDPAKRYEGYRGRAFCPTPRAIAVIARAGASPPCAPSVDVLRRVNHRGFCAALGVLLPDAHYLTDPLQIEATIDRAGPTGGWLLKRPFGFAGRARRRVRGGAVTAPDRAYIAASIRRYGGLVVEPLVSRRGDYGLHAYISRGGAITTGDPTVQRCSDTGAWISTAICPPGELSTEEDRQLRDALTLACLASQRAGYFGPIGIDSFRWIDARGAAHFHPLCDLNARYSMGWAIGMGERRPDRDED